ncbi:MAG: prepilin-type N-terminal cleavage/methylation domain-containing protein [Candidatus Hinthialibacter antarcticus]|nr:prepilin-type N-terminal cleavage/methylation domain-containing protein [Candidatus Hinthialibacter antarcticus]
MEPASKATLESHQVLRGFSLLELLVVTAILMILGSISAFNFQNALVQTKVSAVYTKSQQISTEYFLFQAETSVSPVLPQGVILNGHDIYVKNQTNDLANMLRFRFVERLPLNSLIDPFFSREADCRHFLGIEAQKLNSLFPFEEAQTNCLVIVSKGPDGEIAQISSIFDYDGMIYDPTNGVTSNGDIFRLAPHNINPTFIY